MDVVDTRRGSNILADILDWCNQLPGWQQDALRRIVENRAISDDDIAELTLLCKQAGDLDAGATVPELRPLRAEHVPEGLPTGQSVTLRSISHVENVNALSADQELTFAESGLTIIFGYNASGKSGYGRVLRRACRARNKGPAIMPNVLVGSGSGPASAEIIYALDGVEQPPEQWIDDQRTIDPIGAVSFFDSQCAVAHVRDRNDIAFTPFGLDVLPKLGFACKEVQAQLDTDRRRLEALRPMFLQSPVATGATRVGKLLLSLRANTDFERVEHLASLNDAERERLKALPAQLAIDPKKQSLELRNRSRRIGALETALAAAMKALSDDAIDQLKTLATDCAVKAKAAEAAAQVSFSSDPLPNVGQDVWRELWEAARRYSTVVYPDRDFPVVERDDARCVLCQQPLADEAKDRLRRFERFVTDDTAKQAASARRALDAVIGKLDDFGLRDQGLQEQIADVKLVDAAAAGRVRTALAALLRRYRSVKNAHTTDGWNGVVLPVIQDVTHELRPLAEGLTAQADDLEKAADQEERKRLQTQLDELKSREWLATVLGDERVAHSFVLWAASALRPT